MDSREIVERWIKPTNPGLARRINSLLWTYERTRLRHSIARDPLTDRQPRPDAPCPPAAEDPRKL
jgi:hypothetical protein